MECLNLDVKRSKLGRVSTLIAKTLLRGGKVNIKNCSEAVITGSRQAVLDRFMEKYNLGTERKGPFISRGHKEIFLRTVTRMVPKNKRRELTKKISFDDTVEGANLETVPVSSRAVTLREIQTFLKQI